MPRPRRARPSPFCPPRRALAFLVVAGVLLPPATAGAARFQPRPVDPATVVPVGNPAKDYLQLGGEPVRIPLVGPGVLTAWVRAHFAPGEDGPRAGRLVALGLPDSTATHDLSFTPSSATGYGDGRDGVPSGGRRLDWEVPAGEHLLELRGTDAGGAPLLVILYYSGPPQPVPADDAARVHDRAAATPGPAAAGTPLDLRAEIGLDLIYDTNFLNNSDDYLDEWEAGLYPEKYRMRSRDDVVLAPALRLELRRPLLGGRTARLGVKFQRWQYLYNPIKNNLELSTWIRQDLGGTRSLELTFLHAPEQYIRELTDRPPFAPRDDPAPYLGFRFAKNVTTLAYRQSPHRRLWAKLLVENNLRFYNRPFLENDVDCWEVRGNVVWRFQRRLRLSLDYSYEKAVARARDTVLETADNSDDSDGSYERDLYRVELMWDTPFLRPWIRRIDLSGLLMLYWFTTEKDLFEDPFHAGREDEVLKLTLELRTRLRRGLDLRIGTRLTERTVDSPWPGDVALDKDYTKQRVWLGLTYDL